MKRKILLSTFCIFLFANFLSGQTWDGSTDTDWNTPANWSTNAVPIATGNVTIPAGLTTYPKLASNVTINSVDMKAGSQLDFNSFKLTINSTNSYNYFTGAALNNTNAGSDIVIDINTGTGGYAVYFRGTTVNDNITFNLSGANTFNEADIGSSANTFAGNVIFNISSTMSFNLSNGAASQFSGDLVVNRTAGGNSQLFNGGGDITGNFGFTNTVDGSTSLGNITKKTTINGTVNISINQATPAAFQLSHFINQTTGGSINIQNTSGFDVQKDTLKVTALSITGYRGSAYGYFYNNDITGNITLANDVTYGGGYSTYIRSNDITGNATFTNNGTNTMNDADIGSSGNHYTGNVSFTCGGTGSLYISDGDTSRYDGNLTINRTATGHTQAFNSGGIVGGNFSFTNNTAGNSLFGVLGKKTSVGGTVNIALNNTTPGSFQLYHIINQTSGGNINVQNTQGFDVQKDTLKVTALSVTGYRGNAYGYFYNNDITGNITLANDVTYGGGYSTYIRSNDITGNATFTNNGTNTMNDADIGSSGNHYTGNVSFTCGGTGSLYISDGDTSRYDGNLTINRTATGHTQAFNSGGIVGGNFSFTNNTAGNSLFGVLGKKTSVGGTVNIALNNTTPGSFQLYHIINQTSGGNINVQNTQGFDVQKDTLKVTALSVTGYRGNAYGYFYNNDITGNITLANDASYGSGYSTYIRSNNITGDATFTNSGTNTMTDADIGSSGNTYSGNVSYTKTGGPINIGGGDTTQFGGNLTLNSSSGITLSKIKFNGSINGALAQMGTQPVDITSFTMEKTGTGTLTLNDTVTVTSKLILNSGIIVTGTNSNLVIPDGVTYTGGSDQSYVDGPMLKTGNDVFVFPLGQNNVFAPISITAPANITDQFRGQYIADVPNNAGYDSTQRDPTLDHVSSKEYWLLDRTVGTSNVKVTLSWDQNRSGVVNDVPNLRVGRWNGSIWKDEGNGATTGNNSQGTVQSLNAVTSFSPFTLASSNTLNPLPITLLDFTAARCDDNVCLQWSTENENNGSHFEIERANRDNDFKLTGSVEANNNPALSQYAFSDKTPGTGVNFYRLKIVDADGNFKYSNVLPVTFNRATTTLIYPNPARDEIRIISSKNIISVEVSDLSGRLIKAMVANSTNRYNISELQKGIYIVKISGDDNTIVSKKLVVE
ncbi:MAG: T9SS type A sorting domain-containing protein [Ginsengibacter sp.]